MASFFEDFEEKKKKNRKKVMQIVNPSSAVKTSKETKQATKTKTVTPAAKSYVSKNTKRNFAKDYENRKKVAIPSASNLPSLPSVKTSDGSLRTPIRSIREDRRQVENLAAQRKARAAQLDRQTLYEGDKTLNPVQQRAIQSYKLEWENAKTRGDAAGMAMAHQKAERLRRQMGFSAGKAGNEFISPEIAQADRELLNQSGQLAMKQAKLDYEMASRSGNTLLMKEAILEMAALRKEEQFRNLDMRPTMGTDAYGRAIPGRTQREQLVGEAMGKGVAGGLLSLRETANTALRNQARQRWTADKTPEMVNPNALGQRLMRESTMAGAMATQDLSGGKKLLAETAISMGQMLPGMAASAIPVVGPAIGAAMLSGQAAGAKAFELNERGVDPGEALTRGLISGGIEGLTEAIPLARLGKILKGAGGKSLVKNVLGQMGIEGTEESISYTLNYLADKAAADPEAEWTLEELGRNALAGAVAGGALAGAGSLFTPNAQAQLDNARRAIEQNNAHGLVRDEYTNSQDQKVMDEIDEISKRLGLTVRFADRVAGGAANASIRGNVVTIERNNLNPVRFLYGHEVAHYMQEASPDAYTNFRAVIANEKEVSDRVEEIVAEGALNWDQALDEVTADYAGTLIENERILQRFIQENQRNKPLLQKLADAFRGLLQKITGKDKAKVQNAVEALELALEETIKSNRLRTGREARIETRRANQTQRWQENRREDLIQKLIQDYQAGTLDETIKAQVDSLGIEGVVDAYLNGGKNPLLAAYEEGQTRYSFKRAGDTKQAEEMEAQGATRKTIWQATGQTRDAKGDWVEEVDDSGATFYPQGDAKRQGNPDWVRLKELESKMLAGTITQEELTEANNLAKNLRGMPKGTTLGDYLDHPELFQAVPGIEDTPFRMEDIEGKGERSARGIAVSRDLPQDQRLSTTLHETQHELQNREGRPSGANKAYWAGRADADGFVRIRDQKTIQEANRAVSQAFEALPAEVQERVREMNRANLQKDYDRAIELENELLEGPHGDAVQAYLDADFDMRMAYTPREMLPADAYMDTAGEIEARETQKRINMTAEERRETMPDLGWDRAVFADNPALANEAFNDESTPDYLGAVALMQANLKDLQTMEPLATVDGTEIPAEGRITERIMGYLDGIGRKVDRPGFGEVTFTKTRIKNSFVGHGIGNAKIELMAGVPGVIAQGKQIGFSENWKGRGYDSYVFAGPVNYKGETTYLTALVTADRNGNRYYLHEVVDADGNMIYGKKEKTEAAPDRPTQEVRDTVADSVSNPSIPETGAESNEKFSDKNLSSYERAYEMVYGKRKPKTIEEAAAQEAKEPEGRKEVLDEIDQSFATIPTPEKKAKGLPIGKEMKESDAETMPDDDYTNSLLEEAEDVEDLEEFSAPDEESINSALEEAEKEEENRLKHVEEVADALITAGLKPKPKTPKETAKEAAGFVYRKMVDSGAEVKKAAEKSGDKALYAYYNQAKASTAAAQNMIGVEQTDIYGRHTGESLADIFRPIKEKGDEYYESFESYLFHRHNINRMGSDEDMWKLNGARKELKEFDATHKEVSKLNEVELKEEAAKGNAAARERMQLLNQVRTIARKVKPVFGFEVSAEDSLAISNRLVRENPEFKELAEKVYKYTRNLMQIRVDSGLITQELANKFYELYPHYVPTYRLRDDEDERRSLSENVRIGKTVKRAKGGNDPLMPIDLAIAKQTMNTVREAAKNRFGQRLLNHDLADAGFVVEYKKPQKQESQGIVQDAWKNTRPETENTFMVHKNGKAVDVVVTEEMFEAVMSLAPDRKNSDNAFVRAVRNANNLYKKLITAYNPTFVLKNAVKDAQDALLYSQDWNAWRKNLIPAYKEIATGGEYWRMYRALGGTSSTVYDSIQGIKREKDDGISWTLDRIEAINMAIEQAPRLAEFMSVVQKKGKDLDSLQEAMLAAADVTTNFGRSGQYGKFLNANFVPFLNPSIQGFDKLVRTITDPVRDRSIKAGVMLAARAAALGVAPVMLNYLLIRALGEEEDYEKITNRDKNLNFLIPLGEGKWVKIPRGRTLSVFASMAHGGVRVAKGEKLDILDTWETFQEQVAPINPLDSNIMKPWMDADLLDKESPGKTWYGTDLESQRLQGYRPSERYDENTDEISKKIGKATGLSPKKINYLIDSYSGVVGDVVLPLKTPTKSVGRDPFTRSFVLDSVTSNKLSQEFYDAADQLTFDTKDGDETAEITRKWWNKVSSDIADLNDQIRKKENSSALDTKEKREQIRKLKSQVNDLMESALRDKEKFRETAGKYTDLSTDEAFEKTAREMFGAEEAVRLMGDDEYERARKANLEGATYEDYLDFRDLMKRLDAIYKAEKAMTSEDVEGMSEAQYRIIAQQRVDKLHKEEADLIQTYSEGDTGWKTLKKHHQLAVLEGMELPEEEAVALWYSRILYSDENRKEADMLEFKGLPKEKQYQYYQLTKFANGYEDKKKPGRTKSGSRQDQIIPIIKSMDLTKEQKKLIWIDIENWSANTLYKVM